MAADNCLPFSFFTHNEGKTSSSVDTIISEYNVRQKAIIDMKML